MNIWNEILDILIAFGGDQGGRPGDIAVRFLLPSFFWTVLAFVSFREWQRRRAGKDRLIGIAAVTGLTRELLMFAAEYGGNRGFFPFDSLYPFYPPFEHAATMFSGIFIATAFMNYLLGWRTFSRRYFALAAAVILVIYVLTAVQWPAFLKDHPHAAFGSFRGDMVFRIAATLFIGTALGAFIFGRIQGGRIQMGLLLGFSFLLLDEVLMIFNLASGERFVAIYAPIRHNLHIWAIPLFLGVYWSDLKDRYQRALAGIREERLRSEAIIAAIGDGISIQDTGFRILFQNDIDKGFVGDHAGELCYRAYEGKDAPCEGCPVARTFRDGGIHRGQRTLESAAGLRHFEITASPLSDADGRITAGIEVIRDITESRRLQEEALKSQKLESVGLLAGGLAHDFNNLLTAIYGNIGLARLSLDSGHEACERLDAAERATLRAADVTRQLLTFSKGGAPLRKTSSIVDIVRQSVAFTLSGSNVRAEFAIAGVICPVDVDAGQMSQVFNNLTINAIQAMPNGGTIRIAMDTVHVAEPEPPLLAAGAYVRIVVSDTGIGIPRELQPRIFDPYFTTKQKGNGLGLATVYSIIRNHDGLITVDSEPGKGASFCLHLPASKAARLPEAAEHREVVAGRGSVLIMDDETDVRDTTGAMLTRLGYTCAFASNGDEALALYEQAKAAKNRFDLVIMDLTVPGGTGGKEAIARLLAVDPGAAAIVSSGYSNDPVLADHERYGFKGIITKPYNVEQLGREVHRVLSGARTAGG